MTLLTFKFIHDVSISFLCCGVVLSLQALKSVWFVTEFFLVIFTAISAFSLENIY